MWQQIQILIGCTRKQRNQGETTYLYGIEAWLHHPFWDIFPETTTIHFLGRPPWKASAERPQILLRLRGEWLGGSRGETPGWTGLGAYGGEESGGHRGPGGGGTDFWAGLGFQWIPPQTRWLVDFMEQSQSKMDNLENFMEKSHSMVENPMNIWMIWGYPHWLISWIIPISNSWWLGILPTSGKLPNCRCPTEARFSEKWGEDLSLEQKGTLASLGPRQTETLRSVTSGYWMKCISPVLRLEEMCTVCGPLAAAVL